MYTYASRWPVLILATFTLNYSLLSKSLNCSYKTIVFTAFSEKQCEAVITAQKFFVSKKIKCYKTQVL